MQSYSNISGFPNAMNIALTLLFLHASYVYIYVAPMTKLYYNINCTYL